MKRQQGLSFWGFLFVLVFLLFFAYIGMKVVPLYMDHYSVVTAMRGMQADPEVKAMSAAKLRDRLSRRLEVNYVKAIKSSDIKIKRASGGGRELAVDYEVREPLIGNIDIVVKFNKSVQL